MDGQHVDRQLSLIWLRSKFKIEGTLSISTSHGDNADLGLKYVQPHSAFTAVAVMERCLDANRDKNRGDGLVIRNCRVSSFP